MYPYVALVRSVTLVKYKDNIAIGFADLRRRPDGTSGNVGKPRGFDTCRAGSPTTHHVSLVENSRRLPCSGCLKGNAGMGALSGCLSSTACPEGRGPLGAVASFRCWLSDLCHPPTYAIRDYSLSVSPLFNNGIPMSILLYSRDHN